MRYSIAIMLSVAFLCTCKENAPTDLAIEIDASKRPPDQAIAQWRENQKNRIAEALQSADYELIDELEDLDIELAPILEGKAVPLIADTPTDLLDAQMEAYTELYDGLVIHDCIRLEVKFGDDVTTIERCGKNTTQVTGCQPGENILKAYKASETEGALDKLVDALGGASNTNITTIITDDGGQVARFVEFYSVDYDGEPYQFIAAFTRRHGLTLGPACNAARIDRHTVQTNTSGLVVFTAEDGSAQAQCITAERVTENPTNSEANAEGGNTDSGSGSTSGSNTDETRNTVVRYTCQVDLPDRRTYDVDACGTTFSHFATFGSSTGDYTTANCGSSLTLSEEQYLGNLQLHQIMRVLPADQAYFVPASEFSNDTTGIRRYTTPNEPVFGLISTSREQVIMPATPGWYNISNPQPGELVTPRSNCTTLPGGEYPIRYHEGDIIGMECRGGATATGCVVAESRPKLRESELARQTGGGWISNSEHNFNVLMNTFYDSFREAGAESTSPRPGQGAILIGSFDVTGRGANRTGRDHLNWQGAPYTGDRTIFREAASATGWNSARNVLPSGTRCVRNLAGDTIGTLLSGTITAFWAGGQVNTPESRTDNPNTELRTATPFRLSSGGDNFRMGFYGYYRNTTAGTKSIRIGSDDGSRLLFMNTFFLDHWGDHGFGSVFGTVYLPEGYIPFALEYYESSGDQSLEFEIDGAAVPDSSLFYVSPGLETQAQ